MICTRPTDAGVRPANTDDHRRDQKKSRDPFGDQMRPVRVEAGRAKGPMPAGFRAKGQSGTRVEVRELFFATPARLKFLKSARSEDLATQDIVKRLERIERLPVLRVLLLWVLFTGMLLMVFFATR